MINYSDLSVTRVIIHNILAKQRGQTHSSIEPSDEILNTDERVLLLLKKRLRDAAGRDAKAFEMEIEKTEHESFFDLAINIPGSSKDEFISSSISIAELLGSCQTRPNIPTSYLLIIDAIDSNTDRSIIIVIKAEPHEALRLSIAEGKTHISVLDEVFLSPSQKLFKIGIIYQKEANDDGSPNYGCFLYDDQFRFDSQPASYFYKEFLGFSDDKNAKIQTQKFYDKSFTFFINRVKDDELKMKLIGSLKNEIHDNTGALISPREFAITFIPSAGGLRDEYIRDVVGELSGTFMKDDILILSRLNKRNWNFEGNIEVRGPEEGFDRQVELINDSAALDLLSVENPEYTILKIKGKPYTANE